MKYRLSTDEENYIYSGRRAFGVSLANPHIGQQGQWVYFDREVGRFMILKPHIVRRILGMGPMWAGATILVKNARVP